MTRDAFGVSGEWAGRLIRPEDKELEDLAFTEFIDSGDPFKLGAGDQALVAATFSYLFRRDDGGRVLVLAVPRGAHDVALCVALAAQVTQLSRLTSPLSALLSPWKGSIVVIGQNTAVQTRLGELQVRKAYLRGGVANALRAHRIRTDGRLAAPDGTVSSHDGGAGRLLYLNTRIQWPALECEVDPLVIVDVTRIGSVANVRKALSWASDHQAEHIVVVAQLGDNAALDEIDRAGRATFSSPVPSAFIEPSHRWCSPERSTFASRRSRWAARHPQPSTGVPAGVLHQTPGRGTCQVHLGRTG